MHRATTFVLEHAHWWIILGFTLCAALIFSLAFTSNIHPLSTRYAQAVENSLSILMTLESPKSTIQGAPAPARILGWAVAFCGWLMIPLMLGVLISRLSVKALREKEYRYTIRQILMSRGHSQADAESILNEFMNHQDDIFRDDS